MLKFYTKLLVVWLIVVAMPFVLLWWRHIVENRIEIPQINTTIVLSLSVLVGVMIYTKLISYPGQQVSSIILPLLGLICLVIAAILLVFRVPYSVYQLVFSFCNSLIIAIILIVLRPFFSEQTIGYIPIGRANNFKNLSNKNLYPITSFFVSKKLDMIVADFSSQALDKDWQRFLAHQTIQGMPVYHYIHIYESLVGRSPIQYLYENNLGSLQPDQSYLMLKRLVDIMLILFTLPITLLIILVTFTAVKWDSEGPALFIQYRIGQGGKLFKMYKFRSMRVNAPSQNTLMTQNNDERITKVGKFIRKWRIDELPQFWNVLKGDMSLIGPRPELPTEVERLEQQIPFYTYRQILKPGISGWAQVMQGEGHVENIQTKLEYDFYYIKNFSFTLDFLIVIKTIQTMLTGFGAR